MTVPAQTENQEQPKASEKELNFRALEAKYQRQLEQERAARQEAERKAQEAEARRAPVEQEEDDSEPYVDNKRLDKRLAKFGEHSRQQTQGEIQKAVQQAIHEERKQMWIKSNPDFYDILQHADKFAAKSPELAESILEMPDTFERQKLVYKNIKALGAHLPDQKQPSIQDKVDANRQSPYYQPSGVSAGPYTPQGDYSSQGQKQAYTKMQELKNRLRI